jgi:integrase
MAIYLLFASSGLRKSELLKLQKTDVDFKLRCVKAKHFTRTKKAGVTFYNEECVEYIETYLATRTDSKNRLFRIGNDDYRAIWKKATKAAECKITPQVLRNHASSKSRRNQ